MKGTSSCAKMTTEHSYKVNTYDYCRRCIAPGRWNTDLIMELSDGEIVLTGWILSYRFFDIVEHKLFRCFVHSVIRSKVRYTMNNRIKKYISSKCGRVWLIYWWHYTGWMPKVCKIMYLNIRILYVLCITYSERNLMQHRVG